MHCFGPQPNRLPAHRAAIILTCIPHSRAARRPESAWAVVQYWIAVHPLFFHCMLLRLPYPRLPGFAPAWRCFFQPLATTGVEDSYRPYCQGVFLTRVHCPVALFMTWSLAEYAGWVVYQPLIRQTDSLLWLQVMHACPACASQ